MPTSSVRRSSRLQSHSPPPQEVSKIVSVATRRKKTIGRRRTGKGNTVRRKGQISKRTLPLVARRKTHGSGRQKGLHRGENKIQAEYCAISDDHNGNSTMNPEIGGGKGSNSYTGSRTRSRQRQIVEVNSNSKPLEQKQKSAVQISHKKRRRNGKSDQSTKSAQKISRMTRNTDDVASPITTAVTPSPALVRVGSKVKRGNLHGDEMAVDLHSSDHLLSSPDESASRKSASCSRENKSYISSYDFRNEEQLPQGVINIDACSFCCETSKKHSLSSSCVLQCKCIHELDHNSAASLFECFLGSYGKEYYQVIQESENAPFPSSTSNNFSPSPSSCSSVTSCASSRSPSSKSSSSLPSSSSSSNGMDVETETEQSKHHRSTSLIQNKRIKEATDPTSADHLCLSSSPSNTCVSFPPSLITKIRDSSVSGSSVSQMDSDDNSCKQYIDYMHRKSFLSIEMRAVLIDWLIEVAEEYKISSKTLHMAVGLVDRSLAISTFVEEGCASSTHGTLVLDRDNLQCLGCACMMIACKIEEKSPPKAEDFSYISASSYTRQEITKMELNVCSALRFRLQFTNPIHFVHRFLRASSVSSNINTHGIWASCSGGMIDEKMHLIVHYLLEISTMFYEFVPRKPSLTAAASVYLARAMLGIKDRNSLDMGFWSKTLQFYSGYDLFDLEDAVLDLQKAHEETEGSHLKSVFDKYKRDRYKNIALKTVMSKDALGFF